MALKKYKISIRKNKKGQSVIEYVLLLAIAIICLVVGTNFISNVKGNAFESHFQTASSWISG